MDKIKAWLTDSKNTPIVAAGTVIVIILVALFFLKQMGVIGGGSAEEVPVPTDTTTVNPAAPPATAAPAGPAAPPSAAPPGPGAADTTGGQPTGNTAPPPKAGPVAKMPPMLAYRKDPFLPFAGLPSKKDAMMALLPSIGHIRLAPASVQRTEKGQEPDEILPPQPIRRVAGVMWGSTVKAILETDGQVDIVQPGQELNRGNSRVRVESIEPSGVTLRTLDTRKPMIIRVSLAGSLAAQGQDQNATGPQNNGGPTGNPPRGPRPRPNNTQGGPPTEGPPPGY